MDYEIPTWPIIHKLLHGKIHQQHIPKICFPRIIQNMVESVDRFIGVFIYNGFTMDL